jgi:signal transduction histidine kinase
VALIGHLQVASKCRVASATLTAASSGPIPKAPGSAGGYLLRSECDQSHGVLVSVTDTGPGISSENADRLFDAFFTTKSSGMGMGLSICRSIIQAHGGRISAVSSAGPGARFQLTLPLHQEDT